MATAVGGTAITVNEKKWETWGLIEWDGETRKVHLEPNRRYKVIRKDVTATFDGVEVLDALEVQDQVTTRKLLVRREHMN